MPFIFKILMTLDEFLLPTGLGRINRQEWNQFVGMLACIGGDIGVGHPQS